MKTALIILIAVVPIAGIAAQESVVGEWNIESVGVDETIILSFNEDGTITSPEFSEEEALEYDMESQTFFFPELGELRYTVLHNKLQIFFNNVDEHHPFIQQFVLSFGNEFNNEVEQQFVKEFQKALIQVFKKTPFMIGYRTAVQ